MAETTDFTSFANERPNYFAGQYLLEDDFELQHKYLSDRQRYHNQSLHVSGIIEGLEVELTNPKSVRIKPGSAINSNGELIILKKDTEFKEFGSITNGELYIQYVEEKQEQQQDDVADSYTRWIAKPTLGFAPQTPENSVKLAKLTIQDTITLDANNREYSGLSLPNSNSQALTLRSEGNTNPNLAVLTGSLKVDGDLTVNSKGNSSFAGDLTVTGKLTVDTGGTGSWTKFVVTTTNEWGDKDGKFMTIGAGGAEGIMLSNPHVTWRKDKDTALIHYGRVGSKAAGSFWDAGVRLDESFSFSLNGESDRKLTIAKNGNLTVNTGGTGAWNKLVVTTTSEWGDGANQYVTIGAGGADGIMLSNPHVTWRDNRASIRYGRIGGIQTGSYWDAGVRQDGSFSFSLDGVSDNKLMIAKNGNISIQGAIQPSAGNTENNGIMFPKDPGGGGGDAAWIRYYSRNPNSTDPGLKEQTTLEIGTSNDWNDHIALMSSGGVGIGTTNPTKGKVQIEGSVDYTYPGGYQYINRESVGKVSDNLGHYSLYASGWIGGSEFNAFSDLRIKEILGNSDSQTDLQTLLHIEVTDYYYRDKIAHGNSPRKKVIGQQIADVYPQAVSTHTEVISDILEFAVIAENWVTLKNHNLEIGDKVKIVWDKNNSELFAVKAIELDKFKISLSYTGDVFIYGREVDDFHVVDYDALSMLHISATQELYKIIKKLQGELSEKIKIQN